MFSRNGQRTSRNGVLTLTSKPLNILRVASDVYPEVMGGISIHVHTLSRDQAALGHNVTVLTSDHGDRALPRTETRDGYTIIRHRESANPLDNSVIPGLIRSLLNRRGEFDVIHAHSHLFFSTNMTALLTRYENTPLAVTNHGLISQTAPAWLQKIFIPTIGRFTLNSADRVFCYTETDRERLLNRGVVSDIKVIPNGIDCDLFSPNENVEDSFQLLFVGRLKKGKGVRYLIDAVAELQTEYPELDLKIVGEGPLRESLETRAREREVESMITFAGQVPNSELPNLHNASTALVLPSLAEGLPRTVLEAMACETPVVTTSLPQLLPIVEDAGYTFPSKDVEALTNRLRELLENPKKRQRMGRSGRKRVVDEYSWSETVRQTTESFREMCRD